MYDCEEIESTANGLGRIERELPDWLHADVAILGEPSGGYIEAGCQGTLRVVVSAAGTRAHSARSWLGDNAIHKLGAVLDRLYDLSGAQRRHRRLHLPRRAVGGAHRRRDRGQRHPRRRVGDGELPLRPGPQRRAGLRARARGVRRPRCRHRTDRLGRRRAAGLTPPAAAALVDAAGGQVRAKYGWTDVARFAALGIPAVNYGPGDPNLAHRADERVEVDADHRRHRHAAAILNRLTATRYR